MIRKTKVTIEHIGDGIAPSRTGLALGGLQIEEKLDQTKPDAALEYLKQLSEVFDIIYKHEARKFCSAKVLSEDQIPGGLPPHEVISWVEPPTTGTEHPEFRSK